MLERNSLNASAQSADATLRSAHLRDAIVQRALSQDHSAGDVAQSWECPLGIGTESRKSRSGRAG